MQFLSAANLRRENHDKHIEDNFPDQQFQKAFQIGPSQGLSPDPNDVLVRSREALFFGADIQTLLNITKQF